MVVDNKNSVPGSENQNEHTDVTFSDILSDIMQARNQIDQNSSPEPPEEPQKIPVLSDSPVEEKSDVDQPDILSAVSLESDPEIEVAAVSADDGRSEIMESSTGVSSDFSVPEEPVDDDFEILEISPENENSAESLSAEPTSGSEISESEVPVSSEPAVSGISELIPETKDNFGNEAIPDPESVEKSDFSIETPEIPEQIPLPQTEPEKKILSDQADGQENPSSFDGKAEAPSDNDSDEEDKPAKKSAAGKVLLVILVLLLLLCAACFVLFKTVLPEREKTEVKAGLNFLIGNYAASETEYLSLMTGNPESDGEVMENLLRTYAAWSSASARSGRGGAGAVQANEKLLDYVSDNDTYRYYYSKNLYHVGRYEDAKKVCSDLIEKEPLNKDYNDLMLSISLAGGFLREEADTYFRLYEITGEERYIRSANYMIPSAPAFSNRGGDFNNYITVIIQHPENCQVVFTVDGSKPDGSVVLDPSKAQGSSSHIYSDGVDFSRYINGSSMILRAISVSPEGVESYETVGLYNFRIEYCPVESLSLNRTELTLTEGDQFALRPDIQPAAATNRNILWKSSDERYVTVDNNGLVTAVNFTDSEDPDVRCQTSVTVDVIGRAMSENVEVVCKVTVVPERIKPFDDTYQKKNLLNFDLSHCNSLNKNTAGWLYMEYHYKVPFLPNDPIVRAEESAPDFYLSHNFYGTENSDGALSVSSFANMQTLGKNTVIRGNIFSLAEYESDETGKQTAAEKEARRLAEIAKYPLGGGYMFSALANLNREPEWYLDADNHYLYLGTDYGTYVCQIFSWYKAPGFSNYDKTEFSSDAEFVAYAKDLQAHNQLYNLLEYKAFTPEDCIVTLIGYKDGVADTVVHAKVVKAHAYWDGYSPTAPSVAESKPYSAAAE